MIATVKTPFNTRSPIPQHIGVINSLVFPGWLPPVNVIDAREISSRPAPSKATAIISTAINKISAIWPFFDIRFQPFLKRLIIRDTALDCIVIRGVFDVHISTTKSSFRSEVLKRNGGFCDRCLAQH